MSLMDPKFVGKTALITGASKAIDRTVADGLARPSVAAITADRS